MRSVKCLDEAGEQMFVEHALLRLHAQDVDRPLERHGLFVGAVLGGKRVEDVGDRHHPRLDRDRVSGDGARVSTAIQLLVMSVGDFRNPLELTRPGDLLEEAVGVRDVALDLEPLRPVEAALRDREIAHFLVAEIRAFLSRGVLVGVAGERRELFESRRGENGRLVGPVHRIEELVELGELAGVLLFDALHEGLVSLAPVRF